MSEPTENWWVFECIRTKMKKSINTKLCIYDTKLDKYISAQLKENGLWEPNNVRSFLDVLNENPDANVIDIGANIGLYSLLAAKLDRFVIAVEPLHDNLNRIHKASQLERVQSNIIGLVNAISNQRSQVKLSIMDYNIGGSYVIENNSFNPDQRFQPTSSSVIVNSILMDDLLEIVNLNQNVSKKYVIKIDIEGFEPYAFSNSTNLFHKLNVIAIFMEFGKCVEKFKKINNSLASDYFFKIKNMLYMLKNLNYEPYETNGYNKLDFLKWKEDWPWDVYFKKCDFIFCNDHNYKLTGI